MNQLRYILASILFLATGIAPVHSSTYSAPDFAYPQKVSEQAEKRLKQSISDKDGFGTIKALIDYSLAQSMISSDNLPEAMSRIEHIAQAEDNDCTRAILYTLLADIYTDIYSSDRWKYDRRDNPLLPLPEDYDTWDGNQFMHKIISLCDSALSRTAPLQAAPLKNYRTIITHDNHTFTFYPTLYDFISRHIISLLNETSRTSVTLPSSWLCRYDKYTQLTFSYISPATQRILSLYKELLSFNRQKQAAFIDCDISRIEFLSSHIYKTTDNGKGTFDILKEMYLNHFASEYSAEILYTMNRYTPENPQRQWLYRNIQSHLQRHPAYFRNGCLENIIGELSTPVVSIRSRNTVVPGDTLHITVNNSNANKFSLDLYRIPETGIPVYPNYVPGNNPGSQPQLVKSIEVKTDSVVPFKGLTTCKTVIEQPGCYFIVPNIDGKEFSKYHSYDVIYCSDIALLHSSFGNRSMACAVNPLTGMPESGVDIYELKNRTRHKIATSAADGFALIDSKTREIFALKEGSQSIPELYYNRYSYNDTSYHASCFTDLAIYHPGDTVKWSAVTYHIDRHERKLLANADVTVTIRDVNYRKKESRSFRTDEWGRISGTFTIPIDGLTGNYRIQIANSQDRIFATKSFTVSDYKLPTYFIEITEVKNGIPQKGDMTLSGKVETYSGFPLSDADVTMILSARNRNIWKSRSPISFHSLSTKTDSEGNFSFELPHGLLASSPIPDGIFIAGITAVSATGESQETTKTFSPWENYTITTSLPSDIDVSAPVRLDIRISDINNNPINDTIRYELKKGSDTVYSGTFHSGNPTVDWSGIPSGNYSITFELTGNATVSAETSESINLYRPDDKMPPVETPLWIPITEYTTDNSNIQVIYGTSVSGSHIRYTVWNTDSILSQGWLTPIPGIHRFGLTLPEGVNDIDITFRTVRNYNDYSQNISIRKTGSSPAISIETECFRDKITPNARETWTFRVKDNTGTGCKSAIILDMYAKALDKLQQNDLTFKPASLQPVTFDIHTYYFNDASTYASVINKAKHDCSTVIIPGIDTYGHEFCQSPGIMLAGGGVRAGSSRVYKAETVHETMLTVNDEVKEEGSNSGNEPETGITESGNDTFTYRDAEVPLAFFNPTLTTDENGRLSYSFTVPDANTRWIFNAIAYNSELLADNFTHDVTSSKPVMVQPNMPRFLRTGDTPYIQASVMNNTGDTVPVSTTVELFDHATGMTVSRHTYNDTIAPQQSAVITTHITTPADSPAIGYRIKSSAGSFTDGEQSIIPILPSSTPIIESSPFYIAPGASSFSMQLPRTPKGTRVTLQFCENPTWYCVTALPGLRAESGKTSIGAMSAIFSAAIAQGIIRNNPGIASALHRWQQSDRSDSTLTSMLERNQDLKKVLLEATPWVMDARSDTERMSRLALLFDKQEIESTYSSNITRLAELQRDKGGWGWIAESTEPSQWCTLNILNLCGQLKRLGYLPDDERLNSMITNAIKYIDNYNARNYAKYPQGDYTLYTFVRDYFKDIRQSTAAGKVTAATIQRIISDWRQQDAASKAISAIILNNNGYRSSAQQILNSIREFSRSSESDGTWWPSLDNQPSQWSMGKNGMTAIILDAFNTIEPGCAEIDRIRQWLILQKGANDWGTSVTASTVIASILNSGSKWLQPSHNATIRLGNDLITPSNVESATGYFRSDISALSPPGKYLTITKPGNQPAWGTVFCQYRDNMKNVPSRSCNAVSIEKRIYRKKTASGGVEWETAGDLTKGDIIKVELLVTVSQDMDYVAITDERAACFEPVEQLPRPIFAEGIYFYRENRDATTGIFVSHLPKGTYMLTYELYANNAGEYSSGIATVQSQYAPALTAHSSGGIINVKL